MKASFMQTSLTRISICCGLDRCATSCQEVSENKSDTTSQLSGDNGISDHKTTLDEASFVPIIRSTGSWDQSTIVSWDLLRLLNNCERMFRESLW